MYLYACICDHVTGKTPVVNILGTYMVGCSSVSILTIIPYSNSELSNSGVQNDREDSVRYDYPTSVEQPNQLTGTYESVWLHEEQYASPAETSDLQDDPQLLCNPAYLGASEMTNQN